MMIESVDITAIVNAINELTHVIRITGIGLSIIAFGIVIALYRK